MNRGKCPEEAKVAAAARVGECEPPLAAHAAECPVCRDVLRIAKWMQELAVGAGGNRPLPDPGLLWQRARWAEMLSERQSKREKAHQALQWAELGLLGVMGAGLAAWAIGSGVSFEALMTWLAVALSPRMWMAAVPAASVGSLAVWAAVGAGGLAAFLLTLGIVAEG